MNQEIVKELLKAASILTSEERQALVNDAFTTKKSSQVS